MNEDSPTPNDPQVQIVHSFRELVEGRFEKGVNAICWPRVLPGDFAELVSQLRAENGVATLEDDHLDSLQLSAAGKVALGQIREDLQQLREQDRDPILNLITGYPRDEDPGPVATDVFSFHADSAPVEADTWLCTYHGASSERLPNDQVQRKIDQPEIRSLLLDEFGGDDGPEFDEFLSEYFYDLHYAPLPGARPQKFGVGNLWRIAVAWPDNPVLPCVHRAPDPKPGDPPRLLLIC